MRWLLLCIVFSQGWSLPKCYASESKRFRQERSRLETRFEKLREAKLEFLHRNRHQSLLFLANQRFDAGNDAELTRLARLLAKKLLGLANSALGADDPTLAYQLLHEAMYFHNPTAEKVVGTKDEDPRIAKPTSTHSSLRWKRREYVYITTDHFQVIAQQEEEGVLLAKRLETLHSVWGQLFFDFWCTKSRLEKSIERSISLEPKARKSRRHRVVLFPSREAYTKFLEPKQPRIGITLGFYDITSRTSYFFSGPNTSTSTQLHEVTHQLFQEVQPKSRRPTFEDNFWAIEGVAMYMESLHVSGPVATVGGLHANRLQFARYRLLQEDFYVPMRELASLGRNALQQDERIRRIYSQSAGLTHFLMDAEAGRYRRGFVDYVKKIYAGKDDIASLADSTKIQNSQLDRAYAEFLDIGDADLQSSWMPPDSLTSLCLGDTQVTDDGLFKMTSQSQLDWLDLARTNVTDAGLQFLEGTRSLRQLSLDGTSVSDAAIRMLNQNLGLEELDLSNTQITDAVVTDILRFKKLKVLWLSNTAFSDASVSQLQQLKSLEFLALDGTKVTEEARNKLRKTLPNLTIE